MSKLNEFDLKVMNKEVRDLDFNEVVEVFNDCNFVNYTTELSDLVVVITAISKLPEEERENAWRVAKRTLKDVFKFATVQIAPRYTVVEMPVKKDSQAGSPCELEEKPNKRKLAKK